MDYPTPEEEYELMYGEELEMMEDFDGKSKYLCDKQKNPRKNH